MCIEDMVALMTITCNRMASYYTHVYNIQFTYVQYM